MGLDHALQHVLDCGDLAITEVSTRPVSTGDPVSDSQDTTQVVGGVAPFRSQPAVIVVQPTDHSSNVEGTVDRVQLVRGTGHPRTIGDNRALHRGAQQLGALLELQGLQTTTERIQENQPGRIKLSYKLALSQSFPGVYR